MRGTIWSFHWVGPRAIVKDCCSSLGCGGTLNTNRRSGLLSNGVRIQRLVRMASLRPAGESAWYTRIWRLSQLTRARTSVFDIVQWGRGLVYHRDMSVGQAWMLRLAVTIDWRHDGPERAGAVAVANLRRNGRRLPSGILALYRSDRSRQTARALAHVR